MILTDREWLRFVTFALVAGGALGSTYTGVLAVRGHSAAWAIGGGVIAVGLIAIVAHIAIRIMIDHTTDPAQPDSEAETA